MNLKISDIFGSKNYHPGQDTYNTAAVNKAITPSTDKSFVITNIATAGTRAYIGTDPDDPEGSCIILDKFKEVANYRNYITVAIADYVYNSSLKTVIGFQVCWNDLTGNGTVGSNVCTSSPVLSTSTTTAAIFNKALSNGVWFGVEYVFDGTSVKMYIDRELARTFTATSNVAPLVFIGHLTGSGIGPCSYGSIKVRNLYANQVDKTVSDTDLLLGPVLIRHTPINFESTSNDWAVVDGSVGANLVQDTSVDAALRKNNIGLPVADMRMALTSEKGDKALFTLSSNSSPCSGVYFGAHLRKAEDDGSNLQIELRNKVTDELVKGVTATGVGFAAGTLQPVSSGLIPLELEAGGMSDLQVKIVAVRGVK